MRRRPDRAQRHPGPPLPRDRRTNATRPSTHSPKSETPAGMSAAPAHAPKVPRGPIMRHVAVMTATGSIGLMAIFVVDFLNLFYIALLGQAELAAAIGYAGTVLFFTFFISIDNGIAGTALVSRALGARRRDGA